MKKSGFNKRLKSMFAVDTRRMFTTPLYYILVGICLVVPILILVMTSMMDGTTSIDPQTGKETVIEGFDNVWQIIGSTSAESQSQGMNMSLTGMCNINMLYFFVAVLVCVFVADDFRSGYAKNLFAVRSSKKEYIASKTIVCFIGGASMIIAFFIGSMLGGKMVNLSFDTGSAGVYGIIMCMLSKILLVAIFVSIFVLASVFAKQKLWLSIILSLCIGMLFFTIIPIISPLDAGILNVIMCVGGGALFAVGFGALSNLVLNKKDIL